MQEDGKDRISTPWTLEDDNFGSVYRKTALYQALGKAVKSWCLSG